MRHFTSRSCAPRVILRQLPDNGGHVAVVRTHAVHRGLDAGSAARKLKPVRHHESVGGQRLADRPANSGIPVVPIGAPVVSNPERQPQRATSSWKSSSALLNRCRPHSGILTSTITQANPNGMG